MSKSKDFDNISIIDIIFLSIIGIIVLFGLIGNILLFKEFWLKNRKKRFNALVLILTVFDELFLIFGMSHLLSSQDTFSPLYAIAQVCFCGSAYTTITISLERYLIICHNRYIHFYM